jgi:cytochrome d ubiquinol oxidase subunit II
MITAFWVLMGMALTLYAVTGGADFGGGLWVLFARGPRRHDQRAAVEHAIAPIWETNHIWLIIVVVMLFTAFPKAFAALSIALHVPLTAALAGIVLRGSALVFRSYGMGSRGERSAWGRVLGGASLLTPLFLGMALGATATGKIRVLEGRVTTGFFAGWLEPFSLAVGVFCLALFALSSAVYLAAQTTGEVQRDFARRGIALEVIAGVLSMLVLFLGFQGAPQFAAHLIEPPGGPAFQIAVLVCALAVIVLLWRQRPKLARAVVALQVALIVLGFGHGMHGHVILPDLHVDDAGYRPEVLTALAPAMVLGALVLVPSLFFLYRLFVPHGGEPEHDAAHH